MSKASKWMCQEQMLTCPCCAINWAPASLTLIGCRAAAAAWAQEPPQWLHQFQLIIYLQTHLFSSLSSATAPAVPCSQTTSKAEIKLGLLKCRVLANSSSCAWCQLRSTKPAELFNQQWIGQDKPVLQAFLWDFSPWMKKSGCPARVCVHAHTLITAPAPDAQLLVTVTLCPQAAVSWLQALPL